MHLTGLDRLLWALCLAGHILCLPFLCSPPGRVFPLFSTLIAVNIFRTVLLYFTLRLGSSETYFYTYWTLAIVDVALQLAVAYEVAAHVFQPLGAWAPDVRQSFLVIAIASVLVALGLTWLAAPPTHKLRLAIVLRGEFFSSVVLSELLVAMVALSVTLGLPWRTHVARLAQGFASIRSSVSSPMPHTVTLARREEISSTNRSRRSRSFFILPALATGQLH